MPRNKQALLRYRIIDQCLVNRFRIWTEEDLVEAISDALYEYTGTSNSISRRTLFSDLKAMKPGGITGYEAPIHYTKSLGHHYTDPEYSISQTPLTGSDVVVLEQALHALESIRGVGLATALDDIIRRLERRLAPIASKSKVLSPIQFEAPPDYIGTEWLQDLYEAIQERQPIRLLYHPYHSDTASEVEVHPYMLKVYRHRWFLVGHTPGKAQLRVFALDRIVAITHMNISYVPSTIDLSAYFQHTIGPTVPQGADPEKIHLRFSRGRSPYVRTKPLHSSQAIVVDTADGLEVTLYLVPNPELMTQLLGFGSDMEVLAPTSLRTEIKRRLKAALKRYSG